MRSADELYGDVIEAVRATKCDYAVVIPSYQRADQLGPRTLATLDRLKVDRDRVTVICADEAEAEMYTAALAGDWRVIVGRPGLIACRNWYANEYYPAGTRLLNVDDDIDDMLVKADNKLVAWDGTLDEIARIGWGMSEVVGAKIWGLASAANAFYMHDEAVAGLRYICGILFGSIAGDLVTMDPTVTTTSGGDFDRSIRSYKANGATVRIDWLTPKTTYFGAGGVRSQLGGKDERLADHERALRDIVRRHPGHAKITRKAGNVPNLRLKSATSLRVSRGALEHAAHS